MITSCTGCQTRYRLDDEKVPRRLIRVRCPKCQTVFMLDGTQAATARVENPQKDLVVDRSRDGFRFPPGPATAPAPEPAAKSATDMPSLAPESEGNDLSTVWQQDRTASRPGPPGSPDPGRAGEPTPPVKASPNKVSQSAYQGDAGPTIAATTTKRAAEGTSIPTAGSLPSEAAGGSREQAGPEQTATATAESGGKAKRAKRDKAAMLARALVSDILVYNREARDEALRQGNLLEALGAEIKKSWELYKEKVTPEVANSTTHFRDALNEILAEGEKIF